jgi:hypothetical protein
MSALQHSIIPGEVSYVTFIGPDKPCVAPSTHPNYEQIVRLLSESRWREVDPQQVADLFDIEATITKRFRRLSERVTIKGGKIYVDGDEQHTSLTKTIIRYLNEGQDDWEPLVKFYENLLANPHPKAVEKLYDWLDAEDFTVTDEGRIVGYKSVYAQRGEGDDVSHYCATHIGPAIVDGLETDPHDKVPQSIGSVVEMARGQVTYDPHQDCAYGLHVGTFAYANDFSGDTVLEVEVNPRDVVSVSMGSKMRVCRYTVIGTVEKKYESVVRPSLPVPEATEEANPMDAAAGDPQAVSEPQKPSERVRYKRPSQEEFDKMVGRAKRRRRNFSKYATKQGPWTFTGNPGDDEKNRFNWTK